MPGRCLSSVTCGDALRGEDDRSRNISSDIILQFQSTSSERRTTPQVQAFLQDVVISIHVLREEDDRVRPAQLLRQLPISIHILREEDDD